MTTPAYDYDYDKTLEIPFLINDVDDGENHCLYVLRPRMNEPPIYYIVSFRSKAGTVVTHRVCISCDMTYYAMTVKGRFVVTQEKPTNARTNLSNPRQ